MIRRGFTLLETLLYVVLLSMILAGSLSLIHIALDNRAKVHATFVLGENLRFALMRIQARVQSADQVNSPAAGASASSLSLLMPSAGQNPTVLALSGGVITISEGAGGAVPLTPNEIDITSLTFTRLQGTPAQIRILMTGTMRSATGTYQANLSLTDTASIRR